MVKVSFRLLLGRACSFRFSGGPGRTRQKRMLNFGLRQRTLNALAGLAPQCVQDSHLHIFYGKLKESYGRGTKNSRPKTQQWEGKEK